MEKKTIEVINRVYEKDSLVAINTAEYGEMKISYWEEKKLAYFDNVEFKVPSIFGKFMKFIPERVRLWKNGEIQKMLPYWMYGVFVKGANRNILVTRCYYHLDSKKTSESLPFGKKVVGFVEIKISTNSKTGEKKLIINFVYSGEQKRALKKIVINGEPSKEKINFEAIIPGSGGKKISIIDI